MHCLSDCCFIQYIHLLLLWSNNNDEICGGRRCCLHDSLAFISSRCSTLYDFDVDSFATHFLFHRLHHIQLLFGNIQSGTFLFFVFNRMRWLISNHSVFLNSFADYEQNFFLFHGIACCSLNRQNVKLVLKNIFLPKLLRSIVNFNILNMLKFTPERKSFWKKCIFQDELHILNTSF